MNQSKTETRRRMLVALVVSLALCAVGIVPATATTTGVPIITKLRPPPSLTRAVTLKLEMLGWAGIALVIG